MTQTTTEIIGTYPIFKPLRRINFNFKQDLRKVLDTMQPNLFAQHFPSFLARKVGREFEPVVEELNQFVYLNMETKQSEFRSIAKREDLENRLNAIYESVSRQTLDEIEDLVKNDPEFKASFKAIRDIDDKTDILLDTEMILLHNLASSIRSQIDTLFKDSQMILWDLPDEEIDRIILGKKVINVEEKAEFDIGNLADELALASLAQNHVPLISSQVNLIYDSITELSTKLIDFESGFNNIKDKQEQQLLIEIASVFLGKLLGIREPIQLAQKQLNRYLQLQDDISKEANQIGSKFIVELYEEMVEEAMILDSIQKTEDIMDSLSQNSERIRAIYTKIESNEPSGSTSHMMNSFCQFVAKMYHDLEDFRFITEIFQDIPSFTSMGGGVVMSSISEDYKKVPEDSIIFGKNIFKTFPLATTTVYALRGVDLDIKQGEYVAIMGPSGSGKTTLLNILSGIEDSDRGQVVVADLDLNSAKESLLVRFRRDTIAFIYQAYNLLPNLKNKENVQLPADLGTKKEIGDKNKRSVQLLEQVGLEDYPEGFPLRLSGGQQQRVTIARALMNKPEIIYADEPTGDLDAITGAQVLDVLDEFRNEGVTIVVVTHDQQVADRADRIIYMTDGKVVSKDDAKL